MVYFLRRDAPHDAKCVWVGMIVEECAGNDIRPVFDTTWPRDEDMPLLDKVGESVILDICVSLY